MELDISALERAITRLQEAVEAYQKDTTQSLIRDGLIQRFEFTYDISHKLLRRYVGTNPGPPDLISNANFADLIRIANQHGLLLTD